MTSPITPSPPVVAVLVTHDPGDWFDDVLASLKAQDYPTFGVLVLDSSGDSSVVDKVAAQLPAASVRSVGADLGFSEKANMVAGLVEGAAYYLFCHDDVALAPDATGIMVREATRSNASIVGPKTVQWSDPRRLLAVGSSADKTGSIAPFVEPGELDQEQHDRVRDVFFIPGGCTLVRADLFHELRGFDTEMEYLGEDLDLCWRAQVAGARVMVAPDAVVRHVEALGGRRGVDDRRKLQARHRVRSLLSCSGFLSLVFIVPIALLMTLVEAIYALLHGRISHAKDVVFAWTWNFRRIGSLYRKRRRVAKSRTVSDFDIWRLQTRGSARLRTFIADQLQNDQRWRQVADRGREVAGSLRGGSGRTVALLVIGVVTLLGFGGRNLITRGIPDFGDFIPLADGWTAIFSTAANGIDSQGIGAEVPASSGETLLGAIQFLTFGTSSLLRYVAALGAIPLGLYGAWRVARPIGSRRAGAAAVAVYASVTFGIDALSAGSWSLLVAYAAAPFVFVRLLRLGGHAPYGDRHGSLGANSVQRSFAYQTMSLGLVVGFTLAFSPQAVFLAPLMAVGLLVGAFATGRPVDGIRSFLGAILGVALGVALNAPYLWSRYDAGLDLAELWGTNRFLESAKFEDIASFNLGDHGSVLGWGLLAIAALGLFVARDWRAAWAVRAWSVCIVGVGATWVVAQGWLSVDMPALPFVLLVAAPAVALSAAIFVASIEQDVITLGFGPRQLVAPLGLLLIAVVMVPVLSASLDGSWGMPRGGIQSSVSFVSNVDDGSHRVLWIGDPVLLPGYSWPISPDVSVAVSTDGPPQLSSRFGLPSEAAGEPFVDVLERMMGAETSRAGRTLGSLGVRYVVLVTSDAPAFAGGRSRPVSVRLEQAIAAQLDLAPTVTTPDIRVFENQAWLPTRSILTTELVAASALDPESLEITGFWNEPPPLAGAVKTGDTVYLSEDQLKDWDVSVGGDPVSGAPGFGFGSTLAVARDGQFVADRRSPAGAQTTALIQIGLFVLIAIVMIWATNRFTAPELLTPQEVAPDLAPLASPEVQPTTMSAESVSAESVSAESVSAGSEPAAEASFDAETDDVDPPKKRRRFRRNKGEDR